MLNIIAILVYKTVLGFTFKEITCSKKFCLYQILQQNYNHILLWLLGTEVLLECFHAHGFLVVSRQHVKSFWFAVTQT